MNEAVATHFPQATAGPISPKLRQHLLGAIYIFVLVLLAYHPAMQGDFIWDDDQYVTQNQTLRSIEGLGRIWFEPTSIPQYYPLVHSTFWIEYQLWGLDARGYHLVNVVLHALGAIALWVVLQQLRVPVAWLVAAVFAVHPVHVESVAWITERKNVLSGLMYLLSALCWIRYFNLGLGKPPTRPWLMYLAGFLLFIGALLSKTVTCSLPAALLLVIYWKQGTIRWRQVAALVPLFVVGLAMGLYTAHLEKAHVGAAGADWDFSLAERGLIAGRALWFYAGKLVWPSHLTFIYERWTIDAGLWWQWLFPLAAVGVLMISWNMRKRWGRAPLAALLFFGGTLLPALGFFNVYPMLYSFVADHFQYLASIGVITLLISSAGWLWQQRFATRTGQRIGIALAGVLLGTLVLISGRQGYIYQNVETLWIDNIRKNPTCWMAYNNLGVLYYSHGQLDQAGQLLETALQIREEYDLLYNLGNVRWKQGRTDQALQLFERSIEREPRAENARLNYAVMLRTQGREQEAITQYEVLLARNPNHFAAYNNLSVLYRESSDVTLRNLARARQLAVKAVELSQGRSLPALINLARVHMELDEPADAEAALERAAGLAQAAGDRALVKRVREIRESILHASGPVQSNSTSSMPGDDGKFKSN